MKSPTLWPWILVLVLAAGAATVGSTLQRTRRQERESEALSTLRAIAVAQGVFRERDLDGNGVADYAGDLQALISANLLPAEGAQSDYVSHYTYRLVTGTHPEHMWMATATPTDPELGDRYFAVSYLEELSASPDPIPLNPECELSGLRMELMLDR